jgi:hypothetical protein
VWAKEAIQAFDTAADVERTVGIAAPQVTPLVTVRHWPQPDGSAAVDA